MMAKGNGDGRWSAKSMADQARAARVLSPDNYVALRGLAYGMADMWGEISGAGRPDPDAVRQFEQSARRFSEGYAEMSEYAALSGRLREATATSVLSRLNKGVTRDDADNLDSMLRRGMLEGMPFKQRMAFVEADIANGARPRSSELRRWVSEELDARLAERGVDVEWGISWTERADELIANRKKYDLNGDEPGIDPAVADLLAHGKPAGMVEVEAFGVVKAARVNFESAWQNIQGLMERHTDVFDAAFRRSCEQLVSETCAKQDAPGIAVSAGEEDKILSLMELDLSLHPEKYGMEKEGVGVQLAFDFGDLDVGGAPAMEDRGEFDV